MILTADELDAHWDWQFVLWAECLMNYRVLYLLMDWDDPAPWPICADCWYFVRGPQPDDGTPRP